MLPTRNTWFTSVLCHECWAKAFGDIPSWYNMLSSVAFLISPSRDRDMPIPRYVGFVDAPHGSSSPFTGNPLRSSAAAAPTPWPGRWARQKLKIGKERPQRRRWRCRKTSYRWRRSTKPALDVNEGRATETLGRYALRAWSKYPKQQSTPFC